jgi:hypothetical protein
MRYLPGSDFPGHLEFLILNIRADLNSRGEWYSRLYLAGRRRGCRRWATASKSVSTVLGESREKFPLLKEGPEGDKPRTWDRIMARSVTFNQTVEDKIILDKRRDSWKWWNSEKFTIRWCHS